MTHGRKSGSAILLLGMIALFALAGQPTLAAASGDVTPPIGTVWEFQSLTMGGKTQAPPTALNTPTISFDGRVASGVGFCNNYRASYVSRADVLRFGPAITTKRACAAVLNALEGQYLNLLASTTRYIVSGPNLTLYSGSRDRILFTVQTRPQTGQPAPPRPTPVSSLAVQPMMVNPAPAMSQKGLPPARTLFDKATADLQPDEQLLVLGPQQVACEGVIPQRCLLVKQPAEVAWSLFYGAIEGFAYQPGVTSLLRVRLERLARPAADGSSVRYRLVRVLGTQMVNR
ncbi:DUF4377 domain-containing protein [Deinococcus sp.]|uniref:DUF4377 domain-containing protein n=1 Tax=Deinococcus sp. TaxID=47478 RepID=UPI003C7EAEDD